MRRTLDMVRTILLLGSASLGSPRGTPVSLCSEGVNGIFLSQPTGQAFFTGVFGSAFSLARINIGSANAAATFAQPFPEPFPTPDFFPYFPAYSPASDVTIFTVSPGFRPSFIQQFGLNWQEEFAGNWVLEVG